MSYTIPEGIQTKADAVLAVASVIAGEDKGALGDGSVNTALDVLADVLAGQNVEVPQTNAGAILALADYVGGGGGAQKYPITASDVEEGYTLKFYKYGDYPFTEITEQEAGKLVLVAVYHGSDPGAHEISGGITISCDYGDFAPNKYQWTSDLHQYSGFIMPDCPVGIMYYKE